MRMSALPGMGVAVLIGLLALPAPGGAQDSVPSLVDAVLLPNTGGDSAIAAEVLEPYDMVARHYGLVAFWTLIFFTLWSFLVKGTLRGLAWAERRLPSRSPNKLYWQRLRILVPIVMWIYAVIFTLRYIWGLTAQNLVAIYAILGLVAALGIGGFFFGLAKNAGDRVWRSLQTGKGFGPFSPVAASPVAVADTQTRDVVRPSGGAPAAEAPAGPANRYAVIIGIDQYQDSRIRPLKCAGADARAFRDLLVDPTTCGIPEENTLLLLNEDASERAIRSAMGKWLPERAGPNDVAYVYFAGHGAPAVDPAGVKEDGLEKYLVPFDAIMDDLRSSAISMDTFRQYFDFIASRQLVFFMDSCYSGGVGGRTFADPRYQGRSAILTDGFLEDLGGDGRLVISACDVNEVSIELLEEGHGLFTQYLLKGIAGGADSNGDGTVSVDELYEYVYREVSARARALGARMNPIRKGSVRGSILLSKRADADAAPA